MVERFRANLPTPEARTSTVPQGLLYWGIDRGERVSLNAMHTQQPFSAETALKRLQDPESNLAAQIAFTGRMLPSGQPEIDLLIFRRDLQPEV